MSSLRLDPDVARYLKGPVLDAVAHRVEATGDCVVCHRPLGEGPVSLTLDWSQIPDRFPHVLPAHAACQPSTLINGYDRDTPETRHRGRPIRRHSSLVSVPLLLNPGYPQGSHPGEGRSEGQGPVVTRPMPGSTEAGLADL